jgi:hypothetical protein
VAVPVIRPLPEGHGAVGVPAARSGDAAARVPERLGLRRRRPRQRDRDEQGERMMRGTVGKVARDGIVQPSNCCAVPILI